MRILILHDYGTLNGGAESMSRTLRQGLIDRGHEAMWFSSSAKPLPLPQISDASCFGTTGWGHRFLQAANPHAVSRLRRVLGDFKPDIVHCRMFMTQLSPLILPLLKDRPALLHVVNYNTICPLNTKRLPDGSACHQRAGLACRRSGCVGMAGLGRTWIQHGLWRRWDSAFNQIICNSHWTRARLEEDGVRTDGVIHNGVPPTSPRPPLENPPTAAYAGRLIPKKGVDVLLKAFARVVEVLPEAKLFIAGDGPQRAELESLAAHLGINSHVQFLGHLPRDEMERLLRGAWVQIAPSVWEEPFGLVAAEAGMRGTAAIVSDQGGMAEIIDPDVTGYTTPPANDAQLAQPLGRVLGDRDLAERLGAGGRERVMQHFTEQRVVDKFVALYHCMLERSTS